MAKPVWDANLMVFSCMGWWAGIFGLISWLILVGSAVTLTGVYIVNWALRRQKNAALAVAEAEKAL